MEAEVRQKLPRLKERGCYIFATDHSTPSNVSFDAFSRIVDVAKEVGSY